MEVGRRRLERKEARDHVSGWMGVQSREKRAEKVYSVLCRESRIESRGKRE